MLCLTCTFWRCLLVSSVWQNLSHTCWKHPCWRKWLLLNSHKHCRRYWQIKRLTSTDCCSQKMYSDNCFSRAFQNMRQAVLKTSTFNCLDNFFYARIHPFPFFVSRQNQNETVTVQNQVNLVLPSSVIKAWRDRSSYKLKTNKINFLQAQ